MGFQQEAQDLKELEKYALPLKRLKAAESSS
jgi:hypothetical protein